MELTIKIKRLNSTTITVCDKNDVRLLYLTTKIHKGLYEYFNFKLKMSESSEGTSSIEESVLPISGVSVSLPSDDEIKLKDNGFGTMEAALNKLKGNEL